ncbi:MAG: response regulator transcription factor, partial [Gemmatimonadaceae bacterium]
MSGPRTVVVADDHPLFRRGLVDLLAGDGAVQVVGEAADGEQALALIAAHRPGFAILDIDMPRRNGLEVAAVLRSKHPGVSVILLTMHKSRGMLEGALDAGVRGYVLKENAAADIVACLNMVAEGGTYVSPGVAHHLVSRRSQEEPEDPVQQALATLTPTERKVLHLIASERSTRQIAEALGVTAKTVEHHRSHICVKLGITGINALV